MIVEAALVQGALKAIELAWNWRSGRRASKDADQADQQAAKELAVRLWGSVLMEVRANLERLRLLGRIAKGDIPRFPSEDLPPPVTLAFAPFDFSIADALLPELCRIAPSPEVLHDLRLVLAHLRRVDHFLRANTSAPLIQRQLGPVGTGTARDTRAQGEAIAATLYAERLAAIYDRFNGLVALGMMVGEAVYGTAWAGEAAGIFPKPIDLAGPIDHSAA